MGNSILTLFRPLECPNKKVEENGLALVYQEGWGAKYTNTVWSNLQMDLTCVQFFFEKEMILCALHANIQIHKYTNTQIHKYSLDQIYR